ncbi:hypothetical protein [Stenoxybacter acetivorans]|uniref:hypothetical protein n=1 Tax=Stenoxybacter acetivorans TaxID=422441 RepID=UPI00055DE0D8|nr:hypothetical protein [Stenoxybacter acetivorans]
MTTQANHGDWISDESWDNILTETEQAVFFNLTEEQQDAYLAAAESEEAMQAYIHDESQPAEARALYGDGKWGEPAKQEPSTE